MDVTQTDHPALSREAGSSSGQGGGGGMQGPGSLPHTPRPPPPQNTKTTQQPLLGPTSRTQRQRASGSSGSKVPARSHLSAGPALGERALAPSHEQIHQRDPGACPLRRDSAARQAGHAWHWSLSLTPAIPHPHPRPRHHTGSHLLWQTASLKLLTPVVLIQGVTGDPLAWPTGGKNPSVCPSIYPSILPSSPQPQQAVPSSMPDGW